MTPQAIKCLETRTRLDGLRRRRYLMEDGRKITTVEVPITVLKAVNMNGIKREMILWIKNEATRINAKARRGRIEELLSKNVKTTAIAHEVGVTDQRVRQIRLEMKRGKQPRKKTVK